MRLIKSSGGPGLPPVALKDMGKDHWSTLAYIEHRCVDYKGVVVRCHMRTDPDLHPGLANTANRIFTDRKKYPTILADRRELHDHDDWSCAEDFVHHGILLWNGTGIYPVFQLTDFGMMVCNALRNHKAAGGSFGDFHYTPPPFLIEGEPRCQVKTKPIKVKIPPISKARMAIFAKHPWLSEDQMTKLHRDVTVNIAALRKAFSYSKSFCRLTRTRPLKFSGDLDRDGNLILADSLPGMSPAARHAHQQAMAERAMARDRQNQPFYAVFKVFLRDFWTGNLTGFDVCKFDRHIKPGKNESTLDAVRRLHGEQGVAIIKDLMR